LIGYYLNPSEEKFLTQNINISAHYHKQASDIQEIPTLDEGFDALHIIT
jgi:hypothetical protein